MPLRICGFASVTVSAPHSPGARLAFHELEPLFKVSVNSGAQVGSVRAAIWPFLTLSGLFSAKIGFEPKCSSIGTVGVCLASV